MTGFSCNNNCVMCTTQPKHSYYTDRSTDEILHDLKQGRKQNYKRVEFTGGEPTIRKDILYLISLARTLGYEEIGISTNGRMFSCESFTKQAVVNGLNKLNISLYGFNRQLHDAITRTPGSFSQTLKGIKACLNYPQIVLTVNTVVFDFNYKYLDKIAKYLLTLGVQYWNLLDLIPDGYAKNRYSSLAINSLIRLSHQLQKLDTVIFRFKGVTFFDFPLCLFSEQFRQIPNVFFISAQGRVESTRQIGYHSKRFKVKRQNHFYEDIHKQRIPICKKCKFYNSCGGIWKEYLSLYGAEEIKDFILINNCLVKN